MKAARGKENYFSLVMASVSLLLVGVLLWEWEQGSRLGRDLAKMRKMPVAVVPAPKILPEFDLPDAETGFPELLSRPIFSVSRRPSASANQGVAGAMKRGQFVLVGVLITPNQHSALLRDVETNKTETVAMGAQIRGLTLGEVEPNKVVLRLGAESEELTLKVQAGPPQPPAPGGQGQAVPAAAPAPVSPPVTTPPGATRSTATRPAAAPLPVPKPPPAGPKQEADLSQELAREARLLDAENQQRAKQALPPLKLGPRFQE